MIRLDPRNPRGILWIASYPRSGNTWMRIFLYCLRRTMRGEPSGGVRLADVRKQERSDVALPDYERLAGRRLEPMSPVIARLRPKVQLELARANKGIVTVKTHNAFLSDRGHPMINPQASAGAVYLVRNPLDIAVSYAELRSQDIDLTIDQMAKAGFAGWGKDTAYWASGSWSENVRSWTEPPHPIVLVVRYEDMIAKPVDTFGSVARHIHLTPTPDQLQGAIDMASFSTLQSAEREQGFIERPEKARIFFREGRVGQWQERLTPEQVAGVVATHREMMQKFDYVPA
jgi:sulfotransferase family protein